MRQDVVSFFVLFFGMIKKITKIWLYDFLATAYACKYIDTLRLLWYLYSYANNSMIFLKNYKDLRDINLYK
jgi:hypothetical protein